MSKKHKHKKNHGYFDGKGKKKDKDRKKDKKKSAYSKPAMKSVKFSLSNKEVKEAKKIIHQDFEVDKRLMDIRKGCNHADGVLSAEEFANIGCFAVAQSPMFDAAVDMYGADAVSVCAGCYDVLVNPDCIDAKNTYKAFVHLYLAANKVMSMYRLDKDDEVKAVHKMQKNLQDWGKIIHLLEKIERIQAKYEADEVENTACRSANIQA